MSRLSVSPTTVEVPASGGSTQYKLTCVGKERICFKVKVKPRLYDIYKPGQPSNDCLQIQYVVAPREYDPHDPFPKNVEKCQNVLVEIHATEGKTGAVDSPKIPSKQTGKNAKGAYTESPSKSTQKSLTKSASKSLLKSGSKVTKKDEIKKKGRSSHSQVADVKAKRPSDARQEHGKQDCAAKKAAREQSRTQRRSSQNGKSFAKEQENETHPTALSMADHKSAASDGLPVVQTIETIGSSAQVDNSNVRDSGTAEAPNNNPVMSAQKQKSFESAPVKSTYIQLQAEDVKEIESMPIHLDAIRHMKVRSNSDSVYFPMHPGYNMETKDI
uniref:Major sperm protein n=1 Tax=Parascaris univalens TaxID=6257 RepID=A0A915A1R0_PARUN